MELIVGEWEYIETIDIRNVNEGDAAQIFKPKEYVYPNLVFNKYLGYDIKHKSGLNFDGIWEIENDTLILFIYNKNKAIATPSISSSILLNFDGMSYIYGGNVPIKLLNQIHLELGDNTFYNRFERKE